MERLCKKTPKRCSWNHMFNLKKRRKFQTKLASFPAQKCIFYHKRLLISSGSLISKGGQRYLACTPIPLICLQFHIKGSLGWGHRSLLTLTFGADSGFNLILTYISGKWQQPSWFILTPEKHAWFTIDRVYWKC